MGEYTLYKGYVPTLNKKAQMPFKGKTSKELLDLTTAQRLTEYAGILNDNKEVLQSYIAHKSLLF